MARYFTLFSTCLFFLLCTLNCYAQTTVYCSATGATGSYTTGYASYTTGLANAYSRTDGNILVSTPSALALIGTTDRGYAVFDLSALNIPATATITSVTLTLNYTFVGTNGLTISIYGNTTDLSTVTTASTLYADIVSTTSPNQLLTSYAFGTSSPITIPTSTNMVSFIQANYNSTISIGLAPGIGSSTGASTYTCTGETGSGGSATATAPTLAITYTGCTPTISISHSGSDTLCTPASVTYTSTITNGGTAPSYQWLINGSTISGATTSSYSATFFAGTDVISCVLTSNAACATTPSDTSSKDTLTVISSASPTIHISANTGNTICAGTSVTFSNTHTYGGNAIYQWQKNGSNIPGATNATYTSSGINNGDYFTCVMTSGLSCASPTSVSSNNDTIYVTPSVTPAISISASPGSNICAGASVTFSSTVTNGGTPTYQWKKNGSNITGATGSSYVSSTLVNGDIITCVVTSNAPCASPATAGSNAITMTVNSTAGPTITISASPGSSICVGGVDTFSITGTSNGGTAPTYQWQLNGVNVAGQTATTYATGPTNGDVFTCIITSNAPCASPTTGTSNAITMVVNVNSTPTVTISANPPSPISSGTSVTFTAFVTNGGTAPAYQWLLNGGNIAGQTGSTYTTSALNDGDIVNVFVQSNAPCSFPDTSSSNRDTMTVTTGVQQISASQNEMNIYPNPTNGTFTIHTPGNGILHVISVVGKEVCQFHISQTSALINLPGALPKGIYFGKFVTDGKNENSIVRIVYE